MHFHPKYTKERREGWIFYIKDELEKEGIFSFPIFSFKRLRMTPRKNARKSSIISIQGAWQGYTYVSHECEEETINQLEEIRSLLRISGEKDGTIDSLICSEGQLYAQTRWKPIDVAIPLCRVEDDLTYVTSHKRGYEVARGVERFLYTTGVPSSDFERMREFMLTGMGLEKEHSLARLTVEEAFNFLVKRRNNNSYMPYIRDTHISPEYLKEHKR